MKKKFASYLMGAMLSVGILGACANPSTTSTTATKGNESQAAVSQTQKEVKGTVTYNIDMTKYEKGKKVRLWIPVAQSIDEQQVENLKFDAQGGKATLEKDALGNQMVYVEWDKDAEPASRKVTASFDATRKEVTRPELKESGEMPKGMEEYLKPSKMVVTDGNTKKLAEEITKGKTTTLEKTRAIYDWIIANMNRDESVRGCGVGDVERLLVTKGGKCTDINSVFIGLCRSVGIPAREMFGVRMNADDITKNQHCWAQFYLPGTGWVYADPADVLKAVLKNKWTKDQKETKEKAEYFWGGIDAERVELSRGRDLTLAPAQSGEALNDFGYPYAEVDDKAIDSWEPKDFVYNISFQKK